MGDDSWGSNHYDYYFSLSPKKRNAIKVEIQLNQRDRLLQKVANKEVSHACFTI